MTDPEENARIITYLCEKEGMTVSDLCDVCWVILLGRMAQLTAMTHKPPAHRNP